MLGNEPRQDSQKKKVLAWLKEAGPITPIQALQYFGSFRLASIIHRLRREGYVIRTETIEEDGKYFAEYHYEGRIEELVTI